MRLQIVLFCRYIWSIVNLHPACFQTNLPMSMWLAIAGKANRERCSPLPI